ncbi:hypothetical protein FHW16_002883 [Phyllobacterium myrsinacearum]|uniref:Uncharacterized protein n=1 Tax=Phyllobacterium myrsinacearum TaxID=28101 RepID=A0A839ELS6_9HYPH|nr:hypothetical protein [Phyllobacterium myrsinacearum]
MGKFGVFGPAPQSTLVFVGRLVAQIGELEPRTAQNGFGIASTIYDNIGMLNLV